MTSLARPPSAIIAALRLSRALGVAVGNNYGCPFAGETERRCASYSLSRACNDGDLAIQSHRRCSRCAGQIPVSVS